MHGCPSWVHEYRKKCAASEGDASEEDVSEGE